MRLSAPYCETALLTIDTTEAASPLPRVSLDESNQLKQLSELLDEPVCGRTSAKPHRSAYFCQPELAK